MVPMADSPVLSVSDEALAMIVELLAQEPGDGPHALLVEVTGFRNMAFSYELAFIPLADRTSDQLVEQHGELAVVIPKRDVEKLQGSSLALAEDGLSMTNPNAPASPPMAAPPKGDLTGPLADRVTQVLEEQVNPAVAAHGGAAQLVSVDGTIAYLRLSGGCQGCGMATVTLKQGIEKTLMEAIPELTEVVDITDHQSGSNPYYEKAKK